MLETLIGLFNIENNGIAAVIMMGVILFIGLFALAFFLERFYYLFVKSNVDKERFLSHVKRAILAGDLNAAVNYCNDRSAPLNNVVRAGLTSVMNQGSDDEIQTSMDVAALREIPKVEKRTPFLALFGNIATLMGLLTTITGLISSFKAIADVDPVEKVSILSKGISIAMNGTAFGLCIAIPSLLGFAFLTARTQKIIDDLHEGSVSTLNLVIQNKDKFKKSV